MKVVHVLKRIELIDQDIKELKKLEKSVALNKSFSTPIYMSIEKQINILLGERVKLFELRIENPPENLVEDIEGKEDDTALVTREKPAAKPAKKVKAKKTSSSPAAALERDDDDIPMLTQDLIDARINEMISAQAPKQVKKKETSPDSSEDDSDADDHVKLLDIALEKGTLSKKEMDKEKEKKVRFFRENFPVE